MFQALGGFADVSQVVDGRVTLPDAPGVGPELKGSLYDWLTANLAP